ncbi:MAG: energy-coupling factor transporter ATPase [Dehalococcoidia bacterium]|nr:energy-coupling factor transporter ATPase [Dehalococcoidia bacterium]
MIEFENVTFAYPGREPVLAGFNLSVAEGSFVSLIGRNASGKSTIVKLLNGLLLPQGGSVTVDGRQTDQGAHIREIRKMVQLVFQNPDNQVVGVTVEEDIAFGLVNLGITWPEMGKRIDEALDFTRLRPLRSRPVAELSGGEKQRVAIAGVLVMTPKCVILDEATSMLDDEGRVEVLRLVQLMNKEMGMTVIQITQHLDEVLESDRIVVLDGGCIVLEGTPSNIFAHPDRLQAFGLVAPSVVRLGQELVGIGVDVSLPLLRLSDLDRVLASPVLTTLSTAFVGQSTRPNVSDDRDAASIRGRSGKGCLRIELRNVSFAYNCGRADEVIALRGVQAAIAADEVVAILGRQGSGKSTLLQHLNGLLQPTSGQVLVDGGLLNSQRAAALRARVAMVFQYPEHQLFAPTVFDDIAFAARQRSLTASEVAQRVSDAAALVRLDLDRQGSRRPLELSGGERRRAAIAGALVGCPSILLLDEPMSGLDPLARLELAAIIRSLRAEAGMGIVLVSHSLEEALSVADRLIVMDRGTIAFDGSPDDLFRQAESLTRWGLQLPIVFQFVESLRESEKGFRGLGSGVGGRALPSLLPTPDPRPLVVTSTLHRLDPRTKLLVGLTLTAGLFAANTYPPLLALALVAPLLCRLSRYPLMSVLGSLRPILMVLVGASFLHLFASPGPYYAEFGPFKLSQPGVAEAGMVDLRLASFMIIAALLTWTTSPMAMAEGVERLLSPLARFGVPIRDLSMMVGIALRFVPTLTSELQRLVKVQSARGVDFSQGGLIRRARKLAPLVIPLIITTMERSDELAIAMESRCYSGQVRSRFYQLRFTGLDFVILAGCLVYLSGLLVASRFGQ